MGLGNFGQNANSGNRGSSWRYEYDVLKNLCNQVELLTTIATNTGGIAPGGEQVITSSSVAVSGSVAAGSTSMSFTTSLDFVGSINGATRDIGTNYSFTAADGYTLPAVAYVITAGSIIIDTIV